MCVHYFNIHHANEDVRYMCKFRTGIHPLTWFYFYGWLSILSIRMENPSKSWHFEFGWISIVDLTDERWRNPNQLNWAWHNVRQIPSHRIFLVTATVVVLAHMAFYSGSIFCTCLVLCACMSAPRAGGLVMGSLKFNQSDRTRDSNNSIRYVIIPDFSSPERRLVQNFDMCL